MEYNPIENNFTTFETVLTPKVVLDFPIKNNLSDISDWAISINEETGVPIVKNNLKSKVKVNNPEEIYSEKIVNTDYSINLSASEKSKQALNFFINKGLPIHLAAGIVGNLMLESGLNTTIKGDSGKAFGLAQWHPDRLKGLKELAKKRNKDISDFETQLEYIWQELNSTEKRAFNKLLQSTNVDEATSLFSLHYERPKTPNMEKRISNAKSLLS